jgi:3-phosphoglycerate kinase
MRNNKPSSLEQWSQRFSYLAPGWGVLHIFVSYAMDAGGIKWNGPLGMHERCKFFNLVAIFIE